MILETLERMFGRAVGLALRDSGLTLETIFVTVVGVGTAVWIVWGLLAAFGVVHSKTGRARWPWT